MAREWTISVSEQTICQVAEFILRKRKVHHLRSYGKSGHAAVYFKYVYNQT